MCVPRVSAALAAFTIAASVTAAQDTTAPLDVIITLERTACFGTCPDYTVTVDGRGQVVYQGRKFVRVTGTHRATIDPKAVGALVREFERAKFFDLENEYSALITDNPTTFIGMTLNGRSKRIRDYVAAPDAVKALERRVDEVTGSRRWVYIDPEWVREMSASAKGLPADEARKQLTLAVQRDDVQVAGALLETGVNPNGRWQSTPPLFQARSAAMVDALVARGADVNLVYQTGETPLMWIARWAEPDAVGRLLRAGALVNATARYGETPLLAAVNNAPPQTIEMLLGAGANVAHADVAGRTALMQAEELLRADEARAARLPKSSWVLDKPRVEERRRIVELLRDAVLRDAAKKR